MVFGEIGSANHSSKDLEQDAEPCQIYLPMAVISLHITSGKSYDECYCIAHATLFLCLGWMISKVLKAEFVSGNGWQKALDLYLVEII